jgi:hypothetical protein
MIHYIIGNRMPHEALQSSSGSRSGTAAAHGSKASKAKPKRRLALTAVPGGGWREALLAALIPKQV